MSWIFSSRPSSPVRTLDPERFNRQLRIENGVLDPCTFIKVKDLSIFGQFKSVLGSIIYSRIEEAEAEQKEVKTKGEMKADQSASLTAIFETQIMFRNNRIKVVAKTFKIDNTNPDILGLEYEQRMYEWIYKNIVQKRYSPNFVTFLSKAECNMVEWIDGLNNIQQTYLIDALYKGRRQKVKEGDILSVMLNEKAGNGGYFGVEDAKEVYSFGVALNGKIDNPIGIAQVLFQVVYNLALMEHFRIMHNDLHYGNILVAEFRQNIPLLYVYEQNEWVINTRYIVYFFDWDAGYMRALGNNQKLPDYLTYGMENRFQQTMDFSVLMRGLPRNRVVDSLIRISGIDTPENERLQKQQPYMVTTHQIRELEQLPSRVDYLKDVKTKRHVNRRVYVLNQQQIQAIFPFVGISPTITRIELYIDGKHFLYIHLGALDRNFIEDTRYRSPLDLLAMDNDNPDSPFYIFRKNRDSPINVKYAYTFPQRNRGNVIRRVINRPRRAPY